MRKLLVFLLATAAFAACPSSDTDEKSVAWTHTCVVATTGSDSTGNGTFATPYASAQKAMTQMTAGDKMIIRRGRYYAGKVVSWNVDCGSEANRCYVGNYPGEAVIFDGVDPATGAYHSTDYSWSTPGGSSPYGSDNTIGYWTMYGIRAERTQNYFLGMNTFHQSMRFQNMRIIGGQGWLISNVDDMKVMGVYWDLKQFNRGGTVYSTAMSFSSIAPGISQPFYTKASGGQPHRYSLVNTAPTEPQRDAPVLTNSIFQDLVVKKPMMSASDSIAVEASDTVLFERVRVESPTYVTSYFTRTTGTDSIDVKGTNLKFHDLVAIGGKATFKAWGKVDATNILVQGIHTNLSESAMSDLISPGTYGAGWPANVGYQPIRFCKNFDLVPTRSWCLVQQGVQLAPLQGMTIEVVGMPTGCTNLNGYRRISHLWDGYHGFFSLQDLDGNDLACEGSWPSASDTWRNTSRTVTFSGNSITYTGSNLTADVYAVGIGDEVVFSTTGSLPSPLVAGTHYYVCTVNSTTVTVRTAFATSCTVGDYISFSGGSGTHTMTYYSRIYSYQGYYKGWEAHNFDSYGNRYQYVTGHSPRYYTMLLAPTGMASDAYAIPYEMQNTVLARSNEGWDAAPYAFAGSTRAYINLSSSTINVQPWSSALVAGAQVTLFGTGTPPTGLTWNYPYYVCSVDAGAQTVTIGTSYPSCTPITPTGSYPQSSDSDRRTRIYVASAASNYIEIGTQYKNSANSVLFAAGDAVTFEPEGEGSALPGEITAGTTYYILSVSVLSVGGYTNDVRLITISATPGGSAITFNSHELGYMRMHHTYAEYSNAANLSGPQYVNRVTAQNNLYYTANGSGTNSWCAKTLLQDGTSGCLSSTGEMSSLESGSSVADPALDYDTGRATASTPAAMTDKGFWAGRHSVPEVADVTAVIKNKWPEKCSKQNCVVTVSENSDFSSPTETITVTTGGQVQHTIIGKSTPLTAETVYYYKLQQGYDIFTGTFTTAAALSSTATLSLTVGADLNTAATKAALDSSEDNSSWDSGASTSCSTGCTLTSPATTKGIQYFRVRRLSGADATITTGASFTRLVQ